MGLTWSLESAMSDVCVQYRDIPYGALFFVSWAGGCGVGHELVQSGQSVFYGMKDTTVIVSMLTRKACGSDR